MKMNVVSLLKDRGLFEDMTSPDLPKVLESPCTVYAGFDPSSDSLQAGNYVTIMVLRHFQRCGHKVIALVGGATGMIGDPSGKDAERDLLDEETVIRNTEGIRENLSRFLDFDHPTAPAKLVNNMDWLGEYGFITFLRDVGKHFRMGAMLGRESVQRRLAGDSGMSYTEFSYQMLQAYDFLELRNREECIIQVGGSDQWGNITAGIELIRRLNGKEAYGLTVPLICDNQGQKFGKSEGNAMFLDASKTSQYDFYQFFLRSEDADVLRFLKVFTEVPLEDIEALAEEHGSHPERRVAHKRLAEEMTRAVHGDAGLSMAQAATGVLFGESMQGLKAEQLLGIFADVPSCELTRDDVSDQNILDVALRSGLCKSKGDARRLIQNGGLYMNNDRVSGVEQSVSDSDIIDGCLLVLKSGKRNYRLVRIS
jgi:tyrosyl-tRNA synthetase